MSYSKRKQGIGKVLFSLFGIFQINIVDCVIQKFENKLQVGWIKSIIKQDHADDVKIALPTSYGVTVSAPSPSLKKKQLTMVQVLHSLFYVLALVASTSSFSIQPGFRQSLTRSYLFSTDEGSSASTPSPARALETVVDGEDAPSVVVAATTEVTEEKNFVRNMNTGEIIEVKWKDPAMEAHTK